MSGWRGRGRSPTWLLTRQAGALRRRHRTLRPPPPNAAPSAAMAVPAAAAGRCAAAGVAIAVGSNAMRVVRAVAAAAASDIVADARVTRRQAGVGRDRGPIPPGLAAWATTGGG